MAAISRPVLRWAACAAVALLSPACLRTSRNDLVQTGAVPFRAPAVFQEWFDRTKACSGLEGSLTSLAWYVIPGVNTFLTGQGAVVGMWTKGKGSGVIVLAGNYAEDELVVRHEMLHALIGKTGHPPEYFTSRCRLTWDTWTTEATHP